MKQILLISLLFLSHALGAFSVSPMITHIDLGKTSSTNLVVHNDSSKEIKVETNLFEKVQNLDGSYTSMPSKDLIIFPPLMKIAPHDRQTLRVMVPPQNKEKVVKSYYKLVSTELPDGTSTNEPKKEEVGVNVQIQVKTAFHVPIYIYPKDANVRPELIKAEISNGQIITWIKNAGNNILRLKEQNAFVNINNEWVQANAVPADKLNALTYGTTIRQIWDCSACLGNIVKGVKITGKAENLEGFNTTKMW